MSAFRRPSCVSHGTSSQRDSARRASRALFFTFEMSYGPSAGKAQVRASIRRRSPILRQRPSRVHQLVDEDHWRIAWRSNCRDVIHNRLGFAIQLCLMRYPGRVLGAEETPPRAMLKYVADQIGAAPDEFALYARREETRRDHMARLMIYLDTRSATLWGSFQVQTGENPSFQIC